MRITKEMENKIKSFIKPFVDVDETCEAVIEHLKHNVPSGSYFSLANYFKNGTGKNTFTDKLYKMWLKNLIDNGRENESIVLSCLKEEYQKKYKDKYKEELKNFVFLVNDEKPELNQKWHYFISYWGYKEFYTKLFDKELTKLNMDFEPLSKEFTELDKVFKCEELLEWYKYALSQQKMKKNN
ncbi:MAG: hypothetical protein IKU66_07030 [Clostridia bacterium]|nr:hypothetical protein [Clostridia bacterium]